VAGNVITGTPADRKISRAELRIILIAVTLASFITPYIGSATNIALPLIGMEFGVDAVTLGWIPTVYLLTSAVFLVPVGRIADMYGLKRIFAIGVGIFTLAAFLCGFATSAPVLIACEVLLGLGGAMIYATGIAILSYAFHASERGRVFGITVAAVYIGLSAGPLIGGVLTVAFGWRSIFFIIVPAGLLTLILVVTGIKEEWGDRRRRPFDSTGALIYGIMLFSLIYGLSLIPSVIGFALIGVASIAFVAFIVLELRVESPVLNIRLFSGNRTFTLSNLAALINYSATASVAFLMSLYLQYNRGFDPMTAGLVLIAQPVMMALFSPFAGRLSDILEPRVVASAGMAITAVCLGAFSFLAEDTSLLVIIGILMLLGSGLAFFSSPNMNAIMSSVKKEYYGVASGMTGTMRLIGQMLSMGIAMMIFSVIIGQVQITAASHSELLQSIHIAFAFAAVLCTAGVICSYVRGNVRRVEM